MRPPRLLPALLLAVVALSGGCGSDDDPEASSSSSTSGTAETATSATAAPTTATTNTTTAVPAAVMMAGESVPVARLTGYLTAICTSAREAATDVDAARRTFNGRAHDGLHLIARGLETVDRTAAATLLQAKQKVEADLSKPPPAAQLVADLNHLADVTRSSLALFEVTADACPPA
jgi:hypothetical protein